MVHGGHSREFGDRLDGGLWGASDGYMVHCVLLLGLCGFGTVSQG
jgi:hypothetical protein